MSKNLPYPEHLYQPIRLEIALVYLKRELRKMLPGIRGGEIWQRIDTQIESWFVPQNQVSVRDFWNGFHGIAMGFKLKIGFIQFLTAENVKWRLERKLPLDEKIVFGDLAYISKKIAGKRLTALELKQFFNHPQNKTITQYWRKEFRKHGQESEPRDYFPIIAVEESKANQTVISIHDGNRRAILAILEGKTDLPAYIGQYTTAQEIPQNFWLPTSFLMELVKEGELIGEENYSQILSILKALMKLSQSGRDELRQRVLIGKNDFRMKLKKDLDAV